MDKPPKSLPNLPCLCATFRRTARALSQLYDDAVRPLGLRTTQFTILQALSLTGEVAQGRLGEILALDSTTLTRTLAIMKRRKWVAMRQGRDGRERLISLSAAGREQFDLASPAWQAVQDRLRSQLGEERWSALFQQNREMTAVATAK
ncbi:MAG: MarR family winged helix-turn-helix transcriptional regulator [Candidatus Acidiferrales bacterium]